MEFSIPAILFTIGSIVILITYLRISRRDATLFRGSIATAILFTFLSASYFLPANIRLAGLVSHSLISSSLAIGTLGIFGYIVLSHLALLERQEQIQRIWLGSITFWLVLFVFSTLLTSHASSSAPTPANISLSLLIGLAGAGIVSTGLIATLLWNYHRVTLPELANRSAFWIFVVLFASIGVAFILSQLPSMALAGLTFMFIALLGSLYGYVTVQILDIRLALLQSIRNSASLALLTTVVLIPIYVADRLNIAQGVSGSLTVIGIAVFVASVCLLLLQMIRDLFDKLSLSVQTNLSTAIATYSREVALSTNLGEVVTATTSTLNRVLNIQRSSLILINNTSRKENAVEFIVLSGVPSDTGSPRLTYVSKDSTVYKTFAFKQSAITQYDLDFDPQYQSLDEDERKFYQSLYLRAFAPIVSENNLIGLIGCGPKLDDSAYTAAELELLLVIGQQVGIALRSARLIDDLRHLNTSMRSLNSQLQIAKQDLEKLDSIKTDFVTIASHELRTPLAQVRGYTDIIDSLNEQGILDEKQTTSLVGNLRRATERIEELITAMMDVSQLDVNAMDLRFVRTKPDTIIKMAIDPLTDAIEQRRLNIIRKDLSDLPAIQADMQRIVQAFSNIIVNAIKFTPDGGTIEISGTTELRDETDHILIIIKDTGVGIHDHDLDLIFQKFYRGFDPQLHSSGSYKFMGAGPGLGTTIAKGIIEGHGGKIWAESSEHNMETLPGTTFYISMPINPPDDARRVMPFDPENKETDNKTLEVQAVSPTVGDSTTES